MGLILQFKNGLITSLNDKIIIRNYEKSKCKTLKLPEQANIAGVQVSQENKNVITCMCLSSDENLFGVTTNRKQLLIYNKDFSIIKDIFLNRVASKIRFTPTNDLVIADKTGDAYLYKLQSNDKPELLLGHLSMLLDVLVTPCNKYVITCDRDEKIRVSSFPNAYNIAMYCLGHKEFVTNIEICDGALVSASGDGTIKLWNYLSGEQLHSIDTNDYVDARLKNEFSNQMEKESIAIDALPVKNIQVYVIESKWFVAAALINYNGLLIFQIDNSKLQYVQSIQFDSEMVSFSFGKVLFILTVEGYLSYEFENFCFVEKDYSYLNEIYNKIKDSLQMMQHNHIMVLYKRKYDNVQEYLERKKQRLNKDTI